jgi:hypothetical protein
LRRVGVTRDLPVRRRLAVCRALLVLAAPLSTCAVVPAFAQGVPANGGDGGRSSEVSPPVAPESAPARPKDLVESIVAAPDDSSTRPAGAAEPAPAQAPTRPADRTQVAGWARESVEWPFAPGGYRLGSPSPFDVPHDRLVARTQVHVRASYRREGWFEATVSGALGYAIREQGPADSTPFNGFNGQAANADSQVDLRELYLGFYWKQVDLRIGQQRVAWGKADLQSPNDVLNARDLRDPILTETELRHVPTPLIRLDADLGAVQVEIVGTPVFVPDVYDVYGTNWGPIQADAPAAVKGLFASVSPLVDPSKQNQFNALLHDTQLPASNWTAPSVGAKVSTSLAGIDLDAYYHYGYDPTPFVSVSPSFASFLAAESFEAFHPSDLTPVLQGLDAGVQPFSATYVRRHHVGFDETIAAGPLVLRIDAAYETQRVYYYAKFTSFSSPTVLAVASLEYQTGDLEKVVLVEGSYNRVVNSIDAPLLGYNPDSYSVAGTFRWPIAAGVAADVRGLVGIEPVSFALQPAFRWKANDSVVLKVGAVLLGGEKESLGWYYRRNTSAFVQAKYSF